MDYRIFSRASAFLLTLLLVPSQILGNEQDQPGIELPPGFVLQVFATGIEDVRGLAVAEDGTVFAGSSQSGRVYALRDLDHDGFAETRQTLLSQLTLPAGVAYANGSLYISEVSRIIRLPDVLLLLDSDHKSAPEEIYDWFPRALYQGEKSLEMGPDGKLYLVIGAGCDRCEPSDEMQASIARMDADGSDFEIVAEGVRFAGGMDWQPGSGQLFFSDPGPLRVGELHALDELNVLDLERRHFGFPYCHGGILPDPEFRGSRSCDRYQPPLLRFPAGSNPRGLLFYRGTAFPEKYRLRLFVALAGDWSRPAENGFRIVMVNPAIADGGLEVFASGWLGERQQIRGQPTDLLELADGSLLVSDEYRGMIYRISFEGSRQAD